LETLDLAQRKAPKMQPPLEFTPSPVTTPCGALEMLKRVCAGLAERRMRDDVEPLIANCAAAFDTDTERAFLHPMKGGVDRQQLRLTGLAKLVQNLVVVAFDGTIVVVAVARLFKVMLDFFEARLKILLSLQEDGLVRRVALRRLLK
jgi:hypothetical protein